MEKDYVEIPLTRGKMALVSLSDAERVSQYKWCATPSKSGLWYAVRWVMRNDKKTTESMHRFILGIITGQVDHKDGNGLNNQRENIRKSSVNINNHRRHITKSNSGFRGVCRHPYKPYNGSKYAAYIMVNRKTRYLGLFDEATLAARAYDKAAKEIHGEDAMLNFP